MNMTRTDDQLSGAVRRVVDDLAAGTLKGTHTIDLGKFSVEISQEGGNCYSLNRVKSTHGGSPKDPNGEGESRLDSYFAINHVYKTLSENGYLPERDGSGPPPSFPISGLQGGEASDVVYALATAHVNQQALKQKIAHAQEIAAGVRL